MEDDGSGKAKRTMKRKCETCDFWEKRSGREGHGFCHRYPPPVIEEEEAGESDISIEPYLPGDTQGRWPVVPGEEWCGEWKKREG